MAISTKVITMRQGNKSDYQPSKMLSGELAVINDEEELHFSPKTGKSIRVATENDLKKLGSTVDSALSETSTNPVQNKAVTAKFRELSGQNADKSNSLWAILKKTAFTEQLTDAELNAFKTAWGIEGGGEVEPDEPDTPVTLTSISATYNGGSVLVGTSVSSLTGITVKANYSDGTSKTVTGYTLSGEIVEGSNIITVSYGGKATTFTVTGVVESGGDDENIHDGYISDGLEFRLDGIRNTTSGHSTANYKAWEDVSGNGYTTVAPTSSGGQIMDNCYFTDARCQRSVTDPSTLLSKLANYTVEVVWKGLNTTNYDGNTPVARFGNNKGNWFIANNGQTAVKGNNTLRGTAVTYDENIKHWTVTYDGTNLVLYHEGVQDISMEATIDITTDTKLEFFGDSEWAQIIVGYFYAARVYTRALSAEEVKANYDNDIVRFGTVNVEVA